MMCNAHSMLLVGHVCLFNPHITKPVSLFTQGQVLVIGMTNAQNRLVQDCLWGVVFCFC